MSAHRKGNPDAKSCVDKKNQQGKHLFFYVTAYTASKGPCIKVLCKLINTIHPNVAIYRPISSCSDIYLIINQLRQTQVSGFLQNKCINLSRMGILMKLFLSMWMHWVIVQHRLQREELNTLQLRLEMWLWVQVEDWEHHEMPMGKTFFSPNRQRSREFSTARKVKPCEVIMESLVFINNSINSFQIYYGHFVPWSGKNLTYFPWKADR